MLIASGSQRVNNSPYSLLYNFYDVSSENLVLDQLIISLLIIPFVPTTGLLDIALVYYH